MKTNNAPSPSCCSLCGDKNIYFAKENYQKKTQKTIALRYHLFFYFVEKIWHIFQHISMKKNFFIFGLPQTLSERAQWNLLLEKLSENLKEFIFLDPGENQCVSSGGSRISRGCCTNLLIGNFFAWKLHENERNLTGGASLVYPPLVSQNLVIEKFPSEMRVINFNGWTSSSWNRTKSVCEFRGGRHSHWTKANTKGKFSLIFRI